MTIQHIQKLMIYTEPNKKIVMKKKYEKPTFVVIAMDREIMGPVVGSNGESGINALSKGNSQNLFMENDESEDEENKYKYNLWSED